jgi:hypothetical protein
MTIRVQYKVFLQIKINTCSPASLQLSAVGFGVPNCRSVEQSADADDPAVLGLLARAAVPRRRPNCRSSAEVPIDARRGNAIRPSARCTVAELPIAKDPPWPAAGRWRRDEDDDRRLDFSACSYSQAQAGANSASAVCARAEAQKPNRFVAYLRDSLRTCV